MPQLRFEGLTQSLLRLPQVIRSIPDIIANPASNPLQAAILLGIALVVVLIVLVSVLLVIIRPSRHDVDLYGEAAGMGPEAEEARPLSWLTVTSIVVLVIALLWAVTGVTSANSDVCTSCHSNSVHSLAAKGADPHSRVECVSCHETGGPVARATVNLPLRVGHVVLGRIDALWATGYGRPVASDACLQCHHDQIQGVVVNRTNGVRVSHKQPLAAGAQCADCHVLTSGVVGARTEGMAPCLRCHNETIAKAECKTCHVGDPSYAIRPTTASTSMATVQVPNPQCGSCHFDMSTCNACHGIAMPHSLDFKGYGHARPGAIDIWDNNLRVCRKCHYPKHNDCQQPGCHRGAFPSHPSPVWKRDHGHTPWPPPNVAACQCHNWNPYDHNGVLFCELCHPVKPKNARP